MYSIFKDGQQVKSCCKDRKQALKYARAYFEDRDIFNDHIAKIEILNRDTGEITTYSEAIKRYTLYKIAERELIAKYPLF